LELLAPTSPSSKELVTIQGDRFVFHPVIRKQSKISLCRLKHALNISSNPTASPDAFSQLLGLAITGYLTVAA